MQKGQRNTNPTGGNSKGIEKHNLKPNYDKYNYVATNGHAHIPFSDGKPMKEVEKAMYLGGEIDNCAGRLSELNIKTE